MKPSPAGRDWRPVPRPWDEHWLRYEVAGVLPGGHVASHSVHLQDLGNNECFLLNLAIWQKAGQYCNRKNQETATIVMAAVAAVAAA